MDLSGRFPGFRRSHRTGLPETVGWLGLPGDTDPLRFTAKRNRVSRSFRTWPVASGWIPYAALPGVLGAGVRGRQGTSALQRVYQG